MFNTQGWIHQELWDLRGALELDQKALQAAREAGAGQMEVEANTLVNLATDYRLLGNHTQAQHHLHAAEELVERQDWCSFRCKTRWWWERGELSVARGDCEGARHHAEELLQIAVATGQRKNLAKGWKLKGEALAMANELDQALAELERALGTAEAIGQRNLAWQIGCSLGRLLEKQGRQAEAKAHYTQAAHTIEQIANGIGEQQLTDSFTRSMAVRAVYDSLEQLS
jgi:tetratricopeptide (TPR) repeat protein